MITETDLAPLLRAVPSFESTWKQYRDRVEPELLGHDFCLWLAAHLIQRAAVGDFTELAPAFAALDHMYASASEELATVLTVGFLEDLIHLAEQKGVSVDRIAADIAGVDARAAWDAAYAHTHRRRDD